MRSSAVSRLTGVLALVCIVAIAILAVMRDPPKDSLSLEIAKGLLQLILVSVVGTVVSVLVFEYQRERQHDDKQRELDRKALEYREDLLKSVLGRAMACYSQSKKARRLFRAKGLYKVEDAAAILPEEYDRCFDTLNDAQLELENIARDVLNSERAFSRAESLVEDLRKMEKYLSGLIGEYEDRRGTQLLREGKLLLEELPMLEAFLLPASTSPFKQSLVDPYHNVQKSLRKDLLHPNLPGRADA